MLFIFILCIWNHTLYIFPELTVNLTIWLRNLFMVVSIDPPHFNGYMVVYGINEP